MRLVLVLLFLRKREERIRVLLLRDGDASTDAGLPLGVEGRLAGCAGSCCVGIRKVGFFCFFFLEDIPLQNW